MCVLEASQPVTLPVLFPKTIKHFWPIAWLLRGIYNTAISTCGAAAVLCPLGVYVGICSSVITASSEQSCDASVK